VLNIVRASLIELTMVGATFLCKLNTAGMLNAAPVAPEVIRAGM
jgi:hypothetical protein